MKRKRLTQLVIVLMSSGVLICNSACFGMLNQALYTMQPRQTSRSIGTVSAGRLQGGRRLPSSGENFETYSGLGSLLGRTHVHDKVHHIILQAYSALRESHPNHRFIFAETGWPRGGKFAPHRTHQNGLSVDFVVPVRTLKGELSRLSCTPLNKWCYGLTFDASGRNASHQIDFEALGAHLVALHRSARRERCGIAKVILAPNLHDELLETKHGPYIRKHIKLLKRRAWVRHDDHYHVDFSIG